MKIVDYRDDAPTHCSVCGAILIRTQERGQVHVGPADAKTEWAKEFGLVEGEDATTVWYSWRCPNDSSGFGALDAGGHDCGPVLLAAT